MTGRKTHEQRRRIMERKPDIPDRRQTEEALQHASSDERYREPAGSIRQTEFPVSRTGLHQESRDHNKHNRAGQAGHKPQRHRPAEEKT